MYFPVQMGNTKSICSKATYKEFKNYFIFPATDSTERQIVFYHTAKILAISVVYFDQRLGARLKYIYIFF